MSNSLNTPLRQHREGTPTSVLGGPSPHYVAGKRYALYGNEDRVVLDVGCKFIKFGFSSEATPRGVLDLITCGAPARGLWALRTRWDSQTAKEVKIILQKALRRILQLELMLDARTRKVVFVEHPLWPRQIKGILAGILFDNLQVPSISSVPTHLSALLASGVTTGLVVDLGHLETVLLPVSLSVVKFFLDSYMKTIWNRSSLLGPFISTWSPRHALANASCNGCGRCCSVLDATHRRHLSPSPLPLHQDLISKTSRLKCSRPPSF